MKAIKRIPSITLLLFAIAANGQFLKKLGNKAKRAAERTIERRVEREASKKTDQTLDQIFEKKSWGNETRPIYDFTDVIEMEITTNDDTVAFKTYAGKEDKVSATLVELRPGEQTITILDFKDKLIHALLDLSGLKTLTSLQLDTKKLYDGEDSRRGYGLKRNGQTKTILGHTCEGYDIVGEDYSGTVWGTTELDDRFKNIMKNFHLSSQQNKNSKLPWAELSNGIALEMEIIDTSKRKPVTTHLVCTRIATEALSVDLNEYQTN